MNIKKFSFFFLGFVLVTVGCSSPKASPTAVVPAQEDNMRYLENDRIKLGIDTSIGGAITFLSDKANGGLNMINSHDWGRQIQLSFYSGPTPFIGPNGEKPSEHWAGLGWNPIQAGDAGGNRSKVIEFEYLGETAMRVRCIPMQWPHTLGVPGDCEFECLYTLRDNVFILEATIHNKRLDKTQYQACGQEMPALYTNGSWYKLVTYLGDEPFQDKPVTIIVDKNDGKGWPWVHFYTPEQWVAIVDEAGQGIGIFQPAIMNFNSGFAGSDAYKGFGDEHAAQTGHIAPVGREILDHNISWSYTTSFIVGSVDDIRQYAKEHWMIKPNPEWIFSNSRNGWYYEGNKGDAGWPVKGFLDFQFDGKTRLTGPVTFWDSKNAGILEIEGAFTADSKEITLDIHLQPVGKSDFTDWLNWGDELHDLDKEKADKAVLYPGTPPFKISRPLQIDGGNRLYRINLNEAPEYKGAMKQISLGFTGPGSAKIKSIKLLPVN